MKNYIFEYSYEEYEQDMIKAKNKREAIKKFKNKHLIENILNFDVEEEEQP